MNKNGFFRSGLCTTFLAALSVILRRNDWLDRIVVSIVGFTCITLLLHIFGKDFGHWLYAVLVAYCAFSSKDYVLLMAIPIYVVTIVTRLHAGGCLFGVAEGGDNVYKRDSWITDIWFWLLLIIAITRWMKDSPTLRDEHRIASCLIIPGVCYGYMMVART